MSTSKEEIARVKADIIKFSDLLAKSARLLQPLPDGVDLTDWEAVQVVGKVRTARLCTSLRPVFSFIGLKAMDIELGVSSSNSNSPDLVRWMLCGQGSVPSIYQPSRLLSEL